MIQNFTKHSRWLFCAAILLFSSLAASTLAQNKVSFSVSTNGVPVKGISVGVEGIVLKTNSSGIASVYLPDGDYSFMVYTASVNESIVVGSNTFSYYESGGSDREDRYNNIFYAPTNFTVSGDATIDVDLQSTTFNTTVEGSAASGVFNVLAEYLNRNGTLKTKTITTITSEASGTISIPLPTHRDDRQQNILSFDSYFTSDLYELNTTAFDPLISPVLVPLEAENELEFTITAGGTAVEGIYVIVAGKTLKTDAQGQLSVDLPDGTYYYSVFSGGDPESFKIGGESYVYQDMGGRDGNEDRYDNIFVANAPIVVSGASTADVDLPLTTFLTQNQGVDGAASFDIFAEYSGGKIKTIANLTSDASGNISLPLPTHRSTRNGDTLAFSSYQYKALSGLLSDIFTPHSGLVTIDIPELFEIIFDIQADGAGVEGISVGVGEASEESDQNGQVSFNLPTGDYDYMVYTPGSPEVLTIGNNSFTYNDDGEGGSNDRYDNVFVNATPISVSAAATLNIDLQTTTFHTTIGVSAASVDFDIIAEYLNRNGSLKDKTVINLSSDESGAVTLPLPTHRDDRQGNILSFDTFYTGDSYGNILSIFDPMVSPVNIALAAQVPVDFTITAGGTPAQGIYISISGHTLQTNYQGKCNVELPEGDYYYTVFSGGDPESFTIGSDRIIYQDMGGRNDNEDRYDNIFVANAPLTVSGASSDSVDLSLTTFKTRMQGVDASASFNVIAEYSGGKIKTIAELTSNASGDIALPLPTHRNNRQNDTLAFSFYQYWALNGIVNDTFELDDNPVVVDFPELYETTFNVEAGGTAVEGITLDVNGETYKTNATGQVILSLPAGDIMYSVYTGGTPETIVVGENTITFKDDGGSGRTDAFDNVFVMATPHTVTAAAIVNISLATTTFNTSIGGTAAALDFEISAGYLNDNDDEKRKTLTTLSSNASGVISVPLPTHRDDRGGDTLEYYNYFYADLALSTQGLFDPTTSPVEINIPAQHDITFTVLSGGAPVQGITIAVNKIKALTDDSGQAVMSLPMGEYDYSVMTLGLEETLSIGGESFSYLDLGGSGYQGAYDNIFKRASFDVTGDASESISLLSPVFMTTVGGVAASADFAIRANYINPSGDNQKKTIIHVKSDAAGNIQLPLPTHRTSREGPVLEFTQYSYADLLGISSGEFDPNDSPILIALPASNNVVFAISSGAQAVEGISVRIEDLVAVSDASGELTLSLPDGNYEYLVYTMGKTETLKVGGTTFTYLNEPGNTSQWIGELGYVPDVYDNVFHMADLEVSGASTENIDIGSTTFETSVNGNPAPVSLLISGDYVNDDNELKTKKISAFSTGETGSISLPVPKYRNDRRGNILEFITYHYSDISNTASGLFDPMDSPVQIAFGNLNEVVFSITNSLTSNPVQNAVIMVNGAVLPATDVNGEASTALAAGSYNYTVSKPGYMDVESTAFVVDGATTVDIVMEANVGIEEQGQNSFSFYPNPASDILILEFAEPFTGTVELYSIMGSLIKQYLFDNEQSATLEVSDLEGGFYIIRAGTNSERLLIQ